MALLAFVRTHCYTRLEELTFSIAHEQSCRVLFNNCVIRSPFDLQSLLRGHEADTDESDDAGLPRGVQRRGFRV